MTTYRLTIEQAAGTSRETMAYSSVTNAIDDLEGLRAGGMTISAIHRDGQTIGGHAAGGGGGIDDPHRIAPRRPCGVRRRRFSLVEEVGGSRDAGSPSTGS